MDVFARPLEQELGTRIGTERYLDNRAAPGGKIGSRTCDTAGSPDGYTDVRKRSVGWRRPARQGPGYDAVTASRRSRGFRRRR